MSKLVKAFVSVVFFCFSCPATAGDFPFVNWEALAPSPAQQAKLQMLDCKWLRVSNNLNARIADRKNRMKLVLINPCSTDFEIRELQKDILKDRKMLRYQAMEIFLEKRSILTPEQRKLLHQHFTLK